MDASFIVQKSATGDVTTTTSYLRQVVLTAAAATSTVVVRAGGAAGTIVLSLSAVANTSVPSGDLYDALCSGGVHVTLTGASAVVTLVYV